MFKVADKVKLAQSFSDCYGADMLSLLENYLDGKEKTIAKWDKFDKFLQKELCKKKSLKIAKKYKLYTENMLSVYFS